MIKEKKLNYYNYFLILSLVLIVGYFVTSLFFLNRTWKSGKQAMQYGMTVEKTNSIIQYTSQLESAAYSYMITQSAESKAIYKHKKLNLVKYVKKLGDHCSAHHFANDETSTLNHLINQRIEMLDVILSADTISKQEKIHQVSLGDETTMKILSTLQKIRRANNEMRESNQKEAGIANRNAIFLLTIFGAVMLSIVFISFFKMRKEILRSERYLREINQINSELSGVNKNLENFAYVASHDLSEPLRKIKTFGDLIEMELSNGETDPETVKAHVNRMQSAASRMKELIEDLLSYSRISKSIDIQQQINLNEIVETVMSDLEVSIKESNTVINIDDLPTKIRGDQTQMRQLFQNLISNAIKFRKVDTTPVIDIQSSLVSANEIDLEVLKNGRAIDYWRITVKDNGIGFEEQYTEKIFAVFQRLHGRSAYEGTGIGLSICKKIAENHKGSITAFSKEGEGATFIIYLPAN